MASYSKLELQEKVLSLFSEIHKEFSCCELAELVDKPSQDLSQTLKKMVATGLVAREKLKRGLDQAVYVYKKPTAPDAYPADPDPKRCNDCQWFSGLERCILLSLVKEGAPWALRGELKERAEALSLNKVEKCAYYTPRRSGSCKNKTMKAFIKRNTDPRTLEFRCPVERCGKVIPEFSATLLRRNIGANTVYCPHCGSPINFKYSNSLERYQVQYLDSLFDVLQRLYEQLTGMKLKSRYEEERQYGLSIVKPSSYYLDLENEILYVGNELTPEELVESKDLAYFSLRQLDYIAVKHFEDYEALKEALHKVDPITTRKLYDNIQLLHSQSVIESVEPTLKEIGGNEILIATREPFHQLFYANLLNRKAVLEVKAAELVDGEFRNDFEAAVKIFDRDIPKYSHPWKVTFREWQQIEGGFASAMTEPFKKESEMYGFENVSREKARKVRGEDFLPYGLFIARTPKASFENGVQKELDNEIKEEVYNELEMPWNDLRGWCHRRYPFGLFLDYKEPIRAIAQLWLHEAIRNEEITMKDFRVLRGKRYEKYYCVEQNSHVLEVIQKVKRQTMQTRVAPMVGSEQSVRGMVGGAIGDLKKMLNQLANFCADLFVEHRANNHVKTIWKKLQETKNKIYLTEKENRLLEKHVKQFFREEFVFEPITIAEIVVR
ncbi:MAG: hypothetical protein JXA54_03800 [Candidatus Heimdallarchaeota archaeon]|nr:hypothetical protein [Candidatus Heimdallarchaeota archaeon]